MIGGPGLGRRAVRLRLVGAARAGSAPGSPPTGCCARAASGATATPRRSARAQRARRLRLPPRGRSAGGQGAAAVRAGRLDDRPVHRAAQHAASSCSSEATRLRERPVALEPAARGRRQRRGVLVAGRRGAAGARSASAALVDLRAGRRRHQHDRVRRAQLGARRRRRARWRRCCGSRRRWRRPARWPAAPAPAAGLPAREIRFRDVTLRLPGRRARRCSTGFDLTIPAGSSLAIVGQNGAGKTTLAKLLCRLYDPQAGAIEVDGVDLRELDLDGLAVAGHGGVPGLHPLRAAAARQRGAGRRAGRRSSARRSRRPAPRTWPTSTPCWPAATRAAPTCPAASGSGSRWPGRCAPCGWAPGVVLLDEPTAQLDVRGEAEIFDRILAATRALHDDPDLAPVLDRAPRRPHLRARARPGGRARHARRADGRRRPLPDDVRPAGARFDADGEATRRRG